MRVLRVLWFGLSVFITAQYGWWAGSMLRSWLSDTPWPSISQEWQILAMGCAALYSGDRAAAEYRKWFK